MSIKDDVKNAIDEFGDRAYKRFSVAGIGFVDCKLNDDLTNPDLYIIPKSLHELFSLGCDVYGFEQEVKMWEWQDHNDVWHDCSSDLCDYDEIIYGMTKYVHRRKTSAAREFCLEDAKAGDAIEFLYFGSWIDAEFIETFEDAVAIKFDGEEYGSGENKSKSHGTSIFNFDEIRMKYQKKVKS